MTNTVDKKDLNNRNECADVQSVSILPHVPEKPAVQPELWDYVCSIIEQALEQRRQVNVAIDGMSGAGKSTLGGALAAWYDGNLFHMDDFFLRPKQRTPQRYAQPGGNVDYERFRAEIGDHLADAEGFSFRPFDCKSMTFGQARRVWYKRLNIIEGAYSCHPYFGELCQVRFFVEVSAEEQKSRILARNGPEMYQRFAQEWIPMENRYFEAYGIREKCIGLRTDLAAKK